MSIDRDELNRQALAAAEEMEAQREVDEPDTWTPIDLGPYLRGEVQPVVPTVGFARSDGIKMLYPGKEHSILGEMEAGKSWFALACTAAEILSDRNVVYVHFEESDPTDTVERLQALGLPDWRIQARLHFLGPDRPHNEQAMDHLLALKPSLAILDGVNEAMSLYGVSAREEDGVATFRRRVTKRFTKAGAAVLSCDHVVKDKESRGRSALGSIHKGNALSGASFGMVNREPFGRDRKGRSAFFIYKDRPGHLRRHGNPDRTSPGVTYFGDLVVDDTRTWVHHLDLNLWAPKDRDGDEPEQGRAPGDELRADLVALFTGNPEQFIESGKEVQRLLRRTGKGQSATKVNEELRNMQDDGLLETVPGPRNSTGYRLKSTS